MSVKNFINEVNDGIDEIDGCLNEISRLFFKACLWFLYIVGGFFQFLTFTFLFNGGKSNQDESDDGFIVFLVIVSCIWWWITLRFLFKKLNLPKIKLKNQNNTWGQFLMKNIVAPTIVSLIVWGITGEPSYTIISVPIFGLISASIGLNS